MKAMEMNMMNSYMEGGITERLTKFHMFLAMNSNNVDYDKIGFEMPQEHAAFMVFCRPNFDLYSFLPRMKKYYVGLLRTHNGDSYWLEFNRVIGQRLAQLVDMAEIYDYDFYAL